MRFRVAAFAFLALAPLLLFAFLPLGSSGKSLQSKLNSAQHRLNRAKAREGTLSNSVAAASQRIYALQSDITVLQRRQDVLQRDLDGKKAQLNRLQDQLRTQRAKLTRLRAKLVVGRRVLSLRLNEMYKADRPDFVTVILNSDGFADLLERGEFIERINDQDKVIIHDVRLARDATQRTSDRLAGLEARQQAITTSVLARRNQVASVRISLVDKRAQYAQARHAKAVALSHVRTDRREAQEDVASLQREQARIQGTLSTGSQVAGPIRRGSGQFIWPINGTLTSPFCEQRSYESCHPGIDIAAPTGTPIRAAGSGVVAIAGWTGGYGNYTCIQHGGALSSCYGHQSAIQVSVGQHVSRGQVIGLVGSTGHSTGPHLHFEVRINGSVTNPMNYL